MAPTSTSTPTSVPVENTTPPTLEKMPPACPVCDMMVSLGLASATCENLPPAERTKCHQMLKPLEEKKKQAVDALADLIVEFGDENINDTVDRFNMIMYQATEKAKEKLIAAGKLNKDGTPIEKK